MSVEVIAKKKFRDAAELIWALQTLVSYSGQHATEVLVTTERSEISGEPGEVALLKRTLTDNSHVYDLQVVG